MFLEYLKSNFLELLLLSIVLTNYFVGTNSRKSFLLVVAFAIINFFYQGISSERDVFYLYVMMFLFIVTSCSEEKELKRIFLTERWQKILVAPIVFFIVSLSFYTELTYKFLIDLKSPINYDELLFSLAFLPMVILFRKVGK